MQAQFQSKKFDQIERLYEYVDYTQNGLISRLESYGKETADSATVPVLYIAGQSNAEGAGTTAQIPTYANYNWTPVITPASAGFTVKADGTVIAYNAAESTPIYQSPPVAEVKQQAPVRIYVNSIAYPHVVNGAFEDYDGTNGLALDAEYCGVELSIAYYWATEIYPVTKKQLHIIKSSVDGTPLGQQSASPSNNTNWSTASNQLWDQFLNFTHKPAMLELLESGKRPACLGFIWIQGEADGQQTDISLQYETNLRSLVNDSCRKQLGFPNIKMFIAGLNNWANTDNWN